MNDYRDDDEYSFETLRDYLLPSLHRLISSESSEIMNRYIFIMSFSSNFNPSILSVEFLKYSSSNNININLTVCGHAFSSPMTGFGTNEQLQSPSDIFSLLEHGYVLM